jgi:hypothetical protein
MPKTKTVTSEDEITPTETPEETPATTKETVNFDKEFTVVNPANKNIKVFGMNGDIIEFNEKGEATVKLADAEHLSKIPGYTVKEK